MAGPQTEGLGGTNHKGPRSNPEARNSQVSRPEQVVGCAPALATQAAGGVSKLPHGPLLSPQSVAPPMLGSQSMSVAPPRVPAWRLTQYQRVALIDFDIILHHNADDIFNACRAEICSVSDIHSLNSGVMVLQPSDTRFRHLVASWAESNFDTRVFFALMPDQDFLRSYIFDWQNRVTHQSLDVTYNSCLHGSPGALVAGSFKVVHLCGPYKPFPWSLERFPHLHEVLQTYPEPDWKPKFVNPLVAYLPNFRRLYARANACFGHDSERQCAAHGHGGEGGTGGCSWCGYFCADSAAYCSVCLHNSIAQRRNFSVFSFNRRQVVGYEGRAAEEAQAAEQEKERQYWEVTQSRRQLQAVVMDSAGNLEPKTLAGGSPYIDYSSPEHSSSPAGYSDASAPSTAGYSDVAAAQADSSGLEKAEGGKEGGADSEGLHPLTQVLLGLSMVMACCVGCFTLSSSSGDSKYREPLLGGWTEMTEYSRF